MDAACSSQPLLIIDQSRQRQIPEELGLYRYSSQNIKSLAKMDLISVYECVWSKLNWLMIGFDDKLA